MFFIKKDQEVDDPRREFLVKALTMGAFASAGSAGLLTAAEAGIFGRKAKTIPKGKSIFDLKGDVKVNQQPASLETVISPNDVVETGEKSQIIFVVGKDAFILRSDSRLQLNGQGILLNNLRLITGRLLSVFGRRSRNDNALVATTSTATIGIRGTGVYFESEEDLSYVCTCYGATSIASSTDPNSKEQIVSQHHDAPRYIAAGGASGTLITPAPMKNHTDLELMLVEELVGRTPPFTAADMGYSAPRRGY